MANIFVKLKDTSGSFFIASQGKRVNRSQIVEVEKDELVSSALLAGGLIEVKKEEHDAYHEARNAALPKKEVVAEVTKVEKKVEGTVDEFTKENADELFKKAVEAGKASAEEGKVAIGTKKFDTVEKAVEALLNDEKLRNQTVKAIEVK